MKTLLINLLICINSFNCYQDIDINASNEDIITCHKDTDYTGNKVAEYLSGYYYILGIDSLEGDMINITTDSELLFLDRFDKGWVIHSKSILVLQNNKYISIKSDLDIMNGDFYKCGYLLLNDTQNVKFYFLKK